jgi:hypothetical protein
MDFGVVDVQIMSSTSDEFREYWCNRNHILIKGLKNIFHNPFLFFLGGGRFEKIRYFIQAIHKLYSVILSLVKIITVKDTLTSG